MMLREESAQPEERSKIFLLVLLLAFLLAGWFGSAAYMYKYHRSPATYGSVGGGRVEFYYLPNYYEILYDSTNVSQRGMYYLHWPIWRTLQFFCDRNSAPGSFRLSAVLCSDLRIRRLIDPAIP